MCSHETVTERFADRLALELLVQTFPPQMVDAAVAASGRSEQRVRLLPARTVVYFMLAMGLFPDLGYAEIARRVGEVLVRWDISPARQVPTTAAISRARARLGAEPLRRLFTALTTQIAATADGDSVLGLRVRGLMSVDFTVLDPRKARYRLMVLAETGDRGPLHAKLACAGDPGRCARDLFSQVGPGDLLVLHHDIVDSEVIRAASASDAWLLYGVRDSSPPGVTAPEASGTVTPGTASGEDVQLRTTLPSASPAASVDLTQLYDRYVQFKHLFQERHNGPNGVPPVIRSRSPEAEEQEIWARLLVHCATYYRRERHVGPPSRTRHVPTQRDVPDRALAFVRPPRRDAPGVLGTAHERAVGRVGPAGGGGDPSS
ncbi:transposase domain-containing protein [Streptomyces sp. R08]|uniref:Transposase domain-containing protein n=1 Tax=Streptomyces sp. R08 TaxID=3238624 RepID=A0AB39MN98_9ACTN